MQASLVTISNLIFFIFFLSPFYLGAYNEAWKAALENSVSVTEMITVAVAEYLIIYFELALIHGILRVFSAHRFGPLFVFCRLSTIMIFSWFHVISWSSLHYYGCFFSLRALLSLLTLDQQLVYHFTSSQLRLTADAMLATISATILLGYFFLRPISRIGMNRSALGILLLLLAPGLLTNQLNIIRMLRSAASPEFALASEVFHLGQEYIFAPRSLSFAKIHKLDPWKDLCVDKNKRCPDIVVVVVEALRSDLLSPENNPDVVAPNLNSIASKSTLFTRCYSAAPETGYAIESVLSGAFPYQSPIRHQNYPWDANSNINLVDLLKHFGYRTGYFGATNWISTKRYIQRPSLDTYFDPCEVKYFGHSTDRLLASTEQPTDATADAPVHDLPPCDRQSMSAFNKWFFQKNAESPTFSFVYLASSHFPWFVENPLDRVIKTEAAESSLPPMYHGTDAHAHGSKELYLNAIHLVDSFLGNIISAVNKKRENVPVILIILGDHGEALGEHGDVMHGTSLFDEQVRVPLLISTGADGSARVHSLSSQVDVAPTILSMIGAPNFNGFQGQTLFPGNQKEPLTRKIFITLQAIKFADALIDWPYKAIRSNTGANLELYNLETDPLEKLDISGSHVSIASRMREEIERFRLQQQEYYTVPAAARQFLAPPAQ